MKKLILFATFLLQISFVYGQNKQNDFSVLKGPYLGQTPPGAIPEVFAPGVISTEKGWEAALSFSPDQSELFFSHRSDIQGNENRIMHMKKIKNVWTEPALPSFALDLTEYEAFITPDSQKVIFKSQRPKPDGGARAREGGIWYAQKEQKGWKHAQYLPGAINKEWIMSVTSTLDGTLYFTGRSGIARSRFINGEYAKPEVLPKEINKNKYFVASHPYIAPDESYLIFDAEGMTNSELFISYRKKDGSWTEAIKLGSQINTDAYEGIATVSPDGKYLFFNRDNDIYWVSARVIDDLKAVETAPALSQMTSLEQIDDLAAAYFAQGRIDKSVEAFEYAKSRFPAELYTIIRRLVFYHVQAKQFDKVMDDWEQGQAKGLFFPAESRMYEPLFQTERYRKFLAANKELLITARRNAKAKYDVVLPEGYDGKKKYPLFIVMHGNNINSAVIMPKWKLGKFAGRFILVFLQSSQTTGSESFIWDDLPVGRRDVAACWAWAQGQYRIDRTRVLVGGFSGGAAMAIDAVLRQVIPAAGFIALCPGGVLPGRADMEIFKEAAGKNITGQIIAGEKDDPEEAKALVDLFAEAGLHVGLTVVPGLEHTFPVDLPERLDSAVDLILKR